MWLSKYIAYIKFLLGLPGFLSRTTTIEEAQLITRQRLNNREANFLNILQKAVFNCPSSPYLKLFQLFGYSYEDVKKLINQYGLEKTLEILRDAGIYFSIEEFKGIVPVRRKGIEFKVLPRDFNNPYTVKEATSNNPYESRSIGAITGNGFAFLSEIAVPQNILFLQAHKDVYPEVFPMAWLPAFLHGPGAGVFLVFHRLDKPLVKWFAYDISSGVFGTGLKGIVGFQLIVAAAKLFSRRVVMPEYIRQEETERVLDFIKHYKKQLLVIASSRNIIRICNLAAKGNIPLENVIFFWSGEPLTMQRREKIRAQQANIIATYGFRELGHVAFSCPFCAQDTDEYHLCNDIVALIERNRAVIPGSYMNVFLWTGLSLLLQKIMINVESGDYGKIERRACACLYGRMGLDTRLSNIRSFEKLISEEMAFFGEGLKNLIEEVFPKTVGGNDFDYQFVQEEDGRGGYRLCLYVSPLLGGIDTEMLSNLMYKYLEGQTNTPGIISAIRAQNNIIPIKRLNPLPTRRGKIWPFHKKNTDRQY